MFVPMVVTRAPNTSPPLPLGLGRAVQAITGQGGPQARALKMAGLPGRNVSRKDAETWVWWSKLNDRRGTPQVLVSMFPLPRASHVGTGLRNHSHVAHFGW